MGEGVLTALDGDAADDGVSGDEGEVAEGAPCDEEGGGLQEVAGLAGGCQVARARNGNGMMLNIGGSATTNYTFIVGT